MTLRVTGYVALLVTVFACSAYAQDKADEKAPFPFQEAPEKKDWKWEDSSEAGH